MLHFVEKECGFKLQLHKEANNATIIPNKIISSSVQIGVFSLSMRMTDIPLYFLQISAIV